MVTQCADDVADRWMNEQMFEEDLRVVLSMLRPNRQERLAGWSEYRTGGKHFRATISWDEEFELASDNRELAVPCISEVLETILVGTAKRQDDLLPQEEFEIYRQVVRDPLQAAGFASGLLRIAQSLLRTRDSAEEHSEPDTSMAIKSRSTSRSRNEAAERLIAMLRQGTDIRSRKIRRLRAAVCASRYENDLKLSIATGETATRVIRSPRRVRRNGCRLKIKVTRTFI